MEKTSKVTKAEYTGRTFTAFEKTNYVHVVEFENGDKGEYASLSENQTKFTEGQEATYTIAPNPNGFADKIKPVASFSQGGYKAEPIEHKFIGFAFSYAKDLAVAGKIEVVDISTYAKAFNQRMKELL